MPPLQGFPFVKLWSATVLDLGGRGGGGRCSASMFEPLSVSCRCPFQVILSRYCFPVTPSEYTSKMRLLDVIVRTERTWSCWQWLEKVKEVDRLVLNEICYDDA